MKKGLILLFLGLFCLAGTHVSAYSYEGEYSIDHMIRNYRFVSLGQYDYGFEYGSYSKISDIYSDDMLFYYNRNLNNVVDFRRLNNIIINQQYDVLNNSSSVSNQSYFSSQGNYLLHLNKIDATYYYYSDNGASGYTVFNIEDEFVNLSGSLYCNTTDSCSNVIYNFVNAKYIRIDQDIQGHIVAPKADVLINSNVDINGSIIANNIYYESSYRINSSKYHSSSDFYNYNFDDVVDYNPVTDLALPEAEYNLTTLLKNYNLVAFGKNTKSPVDIYHIVGSFLINGNLGISGKYYYTQGGDKMSYRDYSYRYYKSIDNKDIEGMRLDMRTLKDKYVSFINGRINTIAYTPDTLFGSHRNDPDLVGSCYYKEVNWCYGIDTSLDLYTPIYVSNKAQDNWNEYSRYSDNNTYILTGDRFTFRYNFIDFNKLYTNVVKEQSHINRGSVITPNNGTINVTVGNNYTVNNINDIQYINFDNYKDNESKLTVITINDSGEITMPVENIEYAGTNDYLGKTNIRYAGERILDEDYYGNIVFNIPNATKIKFPSGHAYKGHIIAPNARVEMPEMNIAGCLIVDSITARDHSELHYYPLNNLPLTLVDSNKLRTQIVWADQNNKDAIRPSFVNLKVYVNGEVKYTQRVTAADDWMFEIQLNENDLGSNIELRVEQDGVEGYTLQVDKLSSNQFVITNTHVPGTVKGAEENPKTGIFKYTWIFITPLLLLIPGFIYFNKNSFFKNISKK